MQDKHTLLRAQVIDAVQWVQFHYCPKFIGFLDEPSASVLRSSLRGVHEVSYRFWAGYPEGERTVLGIFPSCYEENDADFPIVPVRFTYREQDQLTHRDFLGALMALGLERDTVGDIVVGNGKATVFLHSNIADFCISQISKIGAIGVQMQKVDASDLQSTPRFEEKTATIASARLDNVVSAVCNTSRSHALQWIEDGLVAIDGIITEKATKQIDGGCKLSIRGYGKFVIKEFQAKTRKGRLVLAYKKYI